MATVKIYDGVTHFVLNGSRIPKNEYTFSEETSTGFVSLTDKNRGQSIIREHYTSFVDDMDAGFGSLAALVTHLETVLFIKGGGAGVGAQRFLTRVSNDGGISVLSKQETTDEYHPFYKYDFTLLNLTSAYKATKLYSIVPDSGTGDMSVSRNGSATRVGKDLLIKNEALNVPRIHYDRVTAERLGVLVEEEDTNLLTHSEAIDDASWVKSNSSVSANAVVSPDGAVTADKLVEDTTTNVHGTSKAVTKAASSIQYTLSYFIKAGERTFAEVKAGDGAGNAAFGIFNLTTGALHASGVTGTGWTLGSTKIEAFKDGWYRCYVTSTSNTDTSIESSLYLSTDGTQNHSYLGDGSSGLYLWGAQLSVKDLSYIPTVASSVTRPADIISLASLQANGFLGADQGTVYEEKNTDKIAKVYKTDGNRDTYINGVLDSTIVEAVPSSYQLDEVGGNIYRVVGMKDISIDSATAIELTTP